MPSYKITISLDDQENARSLAGALSNLVEPAPDALTFFESGPGWLIEGYYSERPDVGQLAGRLGDLLALPVPPIDVVEVPDENWVAISQAALPPVSAGRFTIYGSHDRGLVARGPNTLLIDAGEAFGTAHHATTQGCLVALDRLTRRRAFARVLDLGCGSGVLALAAARVLPHARIEASDNDPLAIEVASANARVNSLAGRIRTRVVQGLARGRIRPGSYDLILANILADPLVELAPDMAKALAPGGIAVLSGLLVRQAAYVIAAYQSHGFSLIHHRRQEGWSTLTLVNSPRAGRTFPSAQPRLAA